MEALTTLTPGLAEQHAAHMARQARLHIAPPASARRVRPPAAAPVKVKAKRVRPSRATLPERRQGAEIAPAPWFNHGIETFAAERGFTASELRGYWRLVALSAARAEFMFKLRFERGWSSTKIGRAFGRDHTTVSHLTMKYEAEHPEVAALVADVEARLEEIDRYQLREVLRLWRRGNLSQVMISFRTGVSIGRVNYAIRLAKEAAQ